MALLNTPCPGCCSRGFFDVSFRAMVACAVFGSAIAFVFDGAGAEPAGAALFAGALGGSMIFSGVLPREAVTSFFGITGFSIVWAMWLSSERNFGFGGIFSSCT